MPPTLEKTTNGAERQQEPHDLVAQLTSVDDSRRASLGSEVSGHSEPVPPMRVGEGAIVVVDRQWPILNGVKREE